MSDGALRGRGLRDTETSRRRRIWVQQVAVDAELLRARVAVARTRRLSDAQQKAADGACEHLRRAIDAAYRVDPIPGRLADWWRGTLVVAAYRNLHAARIQLVDILDEHELRAEIPFAVARARATLPPGDARNVSFDKLKSVPALRAHLRRLMDDCYEVLDDKYAQLRSFRNILLLTTALVAGLVMLTIGVVSRNPEWLPFCFPNETAGATGAAADAGLNCPTAEATRAASGGDVVIVALLGSLGGSLAAALSIRNLRGTSTPYDVPVALALLKVPLGALTAILALVAIRGEFVPGLSNLDSQGQILAYALLFGFGQQALSRLLDQRGQMLLEDLPGGTNVDVARSEARATLRVPNQPPKPALDSDSEDEKAPQDQG